MKQASLLKWSKGGHKHPMTRARGLGSAHAGVHHWMVQRITAVLSIPLTLWLCYSIVKLSNMHANYAALDADYAVFVAWLSAPLNAILMLMSIITFFYHAALGMQVVIEDYVHQEGMKVLSLCTLQIVMFASALACIFAVLKITL